MVNVRQANKRSVEANTADNVQQPPAKKGRGKPKKDAVVDTSNGTSDSQQIQNSDSIDDVKDIGNGKENINANGAAAQLANDTATSKRGRKLKAAGNGIVIKDEPIDDNCEPSTSTGVGRRAKSSRSAAIKANTDMKVKEKVEKEEEKPIKKIAKKKTVMKVEVKEEIKDDEEVAEVKGKSKKAAKGKSTKSKKEEKPEPPKKSGVERTLVKKGRAAVDSLCPIAAGSHVLEEEDDIWDCLLNQTNIQFNNNKYYIIQLLEDDKGGVYSVWMRWGRVGANGQNCLKPFGTNLNQAKQVFTKKFSDKTCNDWEDRDDFEKVPGKYDLLHMDYSDETDKPSVVDQPDGAAAKDKKKPVESALDSRVKALVELICNVKLMEAAVVEMKYDATKAPLGKLTKEQIKAGYLALVEISNIVNQASGKVDNRGLLQACNNFYTRIPHYFGMKVPPLIRTPSEVREKLQLLEALGDIQAAMTFLNSGALDDGLHPADRHYNGLQCDIRALSPQDEAFQLISKYVKLNHGRTHSSYTLTVEAVFECQKTAEKERFMESVGNRQLLWHGSRLSNWAGILSQGLRIAPPEAPVTGYMFGKGIYFADMCSKSANYCMANNSNSTGLLTLCEVALGKTNDLTAADYKADKLPAGTHSVKGVGSMAPQEENFVTMNDGVVIPLGPAKDVKKSSSLLYNEFIVYNPAQVRLRYLVKVKFNFASLY